MPSASRRLPGILWESARGAQARRIGRPRACPTPNPSRELTFGGVFRGTHRESRLAALDLFFDNHVICENCPNATTLSRKIRNWAPPRAVSDRSVREGRISRPLARPRCGKGAGRPELHSTSSAITGKSRNVCAGLRVFWSDQGCGARCAGRRVR